MGVGLVRQPWTSAGKSQNGARLLPAMRSGLAAFAPAHQRPARVNRRVLRFALALLSFCLAVVLAACSTTAPTPRGAGASTSTSPVSTTLAPPSPRTTRTLAALAFFNPTSGYALVEVRSPNSCGDSVAKTANGGAHFELLGAVDSWSCADFPPAQFLAFDDHGDGFAYGPKLFVTHDGGTTWAAVPQPGAVVAVAAFGYSIWMVEGVCPSTASSASTCPLRLLESTDGGRNWEPAPSQPPGATASTHALSIPPDQGQSWLLRVSQSSAYLLSNPTPPQNGLSSDTVPLWHTTDGGRTWASDQVPCDLDALSAMMSVGTDGALATVCATGPATGFQPKSLAVSTTAGATWSVESPCAAQPFPCSSSVLSSGYLGSVAATSSDTVFITGVFGGFWVTRDGGHNWQTEDPGDGGLPAQVVFFDADHGIVLGRDSPNAGAIWHTADGGSTWSVSVSSLM
jgi:photosystem II stability/assembly factor-like uncharacterized protein